VFTAGLMAADEAGELAAEVRVDPRSPFTVDPLELQSRYVLSRLAETLASAGCDVGTDVVRIWQWAPAPYPSDADYARGPLVWPRFRPMHPYARVLPEFFRESLRAGTGIGVRQLPVPGALVEVSAIAVEPVPGVEKEGFYGDLDVAERRAYTPATRYGDWLFLAGFGATDFKGDWMSSVHMGEPSMVAPEARVNPYIWLGSEIEAQTEFTLERLAQLAEHAGTSFERCVKAEVNLLHPSDFVGMDKVWRRWFPGNPPARTVTTGCRIVVKGLRAEIALTLLAGDSELELRTVEADGAPPPIGHQPQAVRAGDFLFLSTQLPVDSAGGVPAQMLGEPRCRSYYADPARAQADVLLGNVAAICEAAGSSLEQVCKVHGFFSDLASLPAALAAWQNAFPDEPPAFSALGMGGPDPLLVPGAELQLDVIAYAPTE
jgi:enamine deaminase RidA (YjgF/YER057c/UK114 family)